MRVLGRGLRLPIGLLLLWRVGLALMAPETPWLTAGASIVILAATVWRPGAGLLIAAALAPAGMLFAPAPMRAAEIFAWAFLGVWLLRLWKPLSPAGWPRGVVLPAALYTMAVAASWIALTVRGAASVAPSSLPWFLLWLIPSDHLILSSPEPETWTMLQSLTGIGVFLAALSITRERPRQATRLAWALGVSMAILALATLGEVVRQWAEADYGAWYLRRYVDGERFSLHLEDFNAAGSLYALAGVSVASLAVAARKVRVLGIGLLAAMLPAMLLAGSVSALAAAILAGLLLSAPIARVARFRPTRLQVTAAVGVIVFALAVSALVASRRGDGRATVSEAMQLRSQFLETSGRMIASSPIFGVGVGRYFDRSAEFMPPALREFYGNENAHNYFAQQFSELGVVGGALFLWLVAAVLLHGRHLLRPSDSDPAVIGLFAGATAYVLTCLTGHPLLVSEAAVPFWAAFGVVAGSGREQGPDLRIQVRPIVAVTVVALLAVHVGTAARSAAHDATPPPERGFHGEETDEQGVRFRWMARHGVASIPAASGFITLRLRAPNQGQLRRPLVIETAVAGRVVDRRQITTNAWLTFDIAFRKPASAPFRRLDLRANQQWMQNVRLASRPAQRPITVMVGEISWTPLDAVGRRR